MITVLVIVVLIDDTCVARVFVLFDCCGLPDLLFALWRVTELVCLLEQVGVLWLFVWVVFAYACGLILRWVMLVCCLLFVAVFAWIVWLLDIVVLLLMAVCLVVALILFRFVVGLFVSRFVLGWLVVLLSFDCLFVVFWFVCT